MHRGTHRTAVGKINNGTCPSIIQESRKRNGWLALWKADCGEDPLFVFWSQPTFPDAGIQN